MGIAPLEAQRIELRVEVTANQVGSDQHQGPERIERGAAQRFGADCRLARRRLFRRWALVGFYSRDKGTAFRRPARTALRAERGGNIVTQSFEKTLPVGVQRPRILDKARILLLEKRTIYAG